MTRARSTNIRSFTLSACERMIRAVDAQLVMPITMMITTRVIRMPATWLVSPTMSRMIGARTRARTNVGRTRKKSVMRIRRASVRPPKKPDAMPMTAPSRIVMTVASRPMTIETRAPWTVRLRMSRPSSSVPKMWLADGGSRGRPDDVVTVSSGPTKSCGAIAMIEKKISTTTPNTPSRWRANWRQKSRWPPSHDRRPTVAGGRAGPSSPVAGAVMPGPAGRAGRRGCRRSRLAATTEMLSNRKMPCRTG